MAVGAPVGTHGDWSVRGAHDGGRPVLVGPARRIRRARQPAHAFRLGMSYSAQGHDRSSGRGVVGAGDRRPQRRQHLRFRSLEHRPRPHARLRPAPRSLRLRRVAVHQPAGRRARRRSSKEHISSRWLRAERSRQARTSFCRRPPPASGCRPSGRSRRWCQGRPLKAEQVHHYRGRASSGEFGRQGTAPESSVRRFRQPSMNQVATLFGVDATSDIGHYYVASPGNVDVRRLGCRTLDAPDSAELPHPSTTSTGVGALGSPAGGSRRCATARRPSCGRTASVCTTSPRRLTPRFPRRPRASRPSTASTRRSAPPKRAR